MMWFIFAEILLCLYLTASTDAVTLTGSSEYAVPGSDFTLTCDVPDEANDVTYYRRPDVSTTVGSVQVNGDQCYNVKAIPPILCTPDVCSCVTTSTGGLGTVFRWVIQPQTGDHGSVWLCRRTNLYLPNPSQDSPDYTLNVAEGPTNSIALSPPGSTYTRTEGVTLPDITCTADCRPGCTFVWTKPDNTNFTDSAVLSLGQLDRSEHGTYRCTAWNLVGMSTKSTNVTVQYGPGESMVFQSMADKVEKVENQTISDIFCSADCRPTCTYIWSKGGTSYLNPLSLSTAVRNNAGQYTCTANNRVSQGTKTWNLIVRFPPNIFNLSHTHGDADVTENGSKSLFCSVESFPPSTIQWYYKANNSVLLTTPDVLHSTYTLTTAGCLDTGLYTCSARNSVSNTMVTRDIRINVLCKPRLYPRVTSDSRIGIATSGTLNIPAVFLSNPQPSFTWNFQNSSVSHATTLANGTDNFAIHNTFEKTNLSAISVGTRSDMQEKWFGLYNVTATNSQGTENIGFVVEATGKPNRPYDGTADCDVDQAILSWRSAFNGGSSQTFVVGRRNHQQDIFIIDERINRTDPGNGQVVNTSVVGLAASTQHFFMVYAVNEYGNSTFEEEVNCTTRAKPLPGNPSSAAIIGGVGSAAAVILVIIVFLVIRARTRASGKNTDGMKPNILYESSDGLKPNVLYESAGPQPGTSSEYAVVQKPSKTKPVSPDAVYAEVDKSKNGKSETGKDVYAEVVKPEGKVKKADDASKNVDPTPDMIYANCKNETKPVSDAAPVYKKNQEGLIYLDVKFKDEGMSGRNVVINGLENRTNYTDIDFTRRADNLQTETGNNKTNDTPQ